MNRSRGRGVAVNMLACQARDRGFESRRPRQTVRICGRFFNSGSRSMGYVKVFYITLTVDTDFLGGDSI